VFLRAINEQQRQKEKIETANATTIVLGGCSVHSTVASYYLPEANIYKDIPVKFTRKARRKGRK